MLQHERSLGTIRAFFLVLGSSASAAALSAQGASRPDDRDALLAAWEASRHAAVPVDSGHLARNSGQRWGTRFDGRGFTVEPDAGGWSWGLALVSYGLAGAELEVSEPREVTADGPRVSYDWDGVLEEWWVNDARGLEHGFTLERRPPSVAATETGALSFLMAVRGGLRAEVEAGGRDVAFRDQDGSLVLTYRGLVVLDAGGREVPAVFECVAEGLRLTIDERGARYPLTIDPVAQQAYLKASNTESDDWFGASVAISGDTAVIGALAEDSTACGVNGDQSNNGTHEAGAAYVFVRSGTSWSQQAYLKASNCGNLSFFGTAVAIDGDTIVVGAYGESSGVVRSGAAYVFVRCGTSWSQQAYLKASNAAFLYQFGISVAISGDTVVVGSENESSNATGVNGDQTNTGAGLSGAAYVFVRSGTSWSQQAYLKASNTESNDSFGHSVAISGDTVVIGAHRESSNATGVNGDQANNGAHFSGAAYVFVRSGTSWSQQAYLKASNTGSVDYFGYALALSGDALVVGATGEDSSATGVNGDQTSNGASNSGAAYLFVREGSLWAQQAYLKAASTEANDQFGESVAISGDVALVGVPRTVDVAGAVYVFARCGMCWEQQAYLQASNAQPGDLFGWSVGVSRGTVLVSALGEDSAAVGVNGDQSSNGAPGSGAAYVLQVCSQAVVVFRNAGPNPATYTASPAVLGGTFTATVDNNVAGQTTSLLFAFDTPTAIALGGGQTLLCLDLGSGELFTGGNLYPTSSAGGVDSYTLAIPNLPQLEGALAYTQALQFGHPPFVLSNAQDLTLGDF